MLFSNLGMLVQPAATDVTLQAQPTCSLRYETGCSAMQCPLVRDDLSGEINIIKIDLFVSRRPCLGDRL